MNVELDPAALTAAVDLVARSGVSLFTFGYDQGVDDGWWAEAQHKGTRIVVEHHAAPTEAIEALMRRILGGQRCRRCRRTVEFTGDQSSADESSRTCRWRRVGTRWAAGCEPLTERSREAS